MHADIEKYVKNCKHCAETAPNPIKETFYPWPKSKLSWNRIYVDFAGPIHEQWLIIVDSYSRFTDVKWFLTITAAATFQYLPPVFQIWTAQSSCIRQWHPIYGQ